MIDEAMGKILGMAMAYGVSSLGLFLAYANYRKRTVGAERIMTPKAWAAVLVTVAAISAAVLVVVWLAGPVRSLPGESLPVESLAEEGGEDAVSETPRPPDDAARWPLLGIVLPAGIFLFATWITGALYLHFSRGSTAQS